MAPDKHDQPADDSADEAEETKAEADDPVLAAGDDGVRRQPITAAPIPPAPPGQQVQVALGMQLIQQSSFDRLEPEIQAQLIELATAMDRHAFENAQEGLRGETDLRRKRIEDGAAGRKQTLVTLCVLASLGLTAGTSITVILIVSGEYQLGHTVMMSGLAVVSALVGGAGLSTIFRRS